MLTSEPQDVREASVGLIVWILRRFVLYMYVRPGGKSTIKFFLSWTALDFAGGDAASNKLRDFSRAADDSDESESESEEDPGEDEELFSDADCRISVGRCDGVLDRDLDLEELRGGLAPLRVHQLLSASSMAGV